MRVTGLPLTADRLSVRPAATRDAWRESVSRVDALQSILRAGNLDLRPPPAWQVYGDSFTLDD